MDGSRSTGGAGPALDPAAARALAARSQRKILGQSAVRSPSRAVAVGAHRQRAARVAKPDWNEAVTGMAPASRKRHVLGRGTRAMVVGPAMRSRRRGIGDGAIVVLRRRRSSTEQHGQATRARSQKCAHPQQALPARSSATPTPADSRTSTLPDGTSRCAEPAGKTGWPSSHRGATSERSQGLYAPLVIRITLAGPPRSASKWLVTGIGRDITCGWARGWLGTASRQPVPGFQCRFRT